MTRKIFARSVVRRSVLWLAAAGMSIGYAQSGSAQAAKPKTLIVLQGGFKSCGYSWGGAFDPKGGRMAEPGKLLRQFVSEAGIENDVKIVQSCFGFVDGSTLNPFSTPAMCLSEFSAFGEGETKCMPFEEPFSSVVTTAISSGKLPEPIAILRDMIEEEIQGLGEDPQIILVGHSYGAWTMMRVALALNRPLRGLVTIDPISPIFCSSQDYWDTPIVPPVGCTQPPQDIIAPLRAKLAEMSDLWINYYQLGFPYLHSGPMDGADHNLERSYTWTWSHHSSHVLIFQDPEIIQYAVDLAH